MVISKEFQVVSLNVTSISDFCRVMHINDAHFLFKAIITMLEIYYACLLANRLWNSAFIEIDFWYPQNIWTKRYSLAGGLICDYLCSHFENYHFMNLWICVMAHGVIYYWMTVQTTKCRKSNMRSTWMKYTKKWLI